MKNPFNKSKTIVGTKNLKLFHIIAENSFTDAVPGQPLPVSYTKIPNTFALSEPYLVQGTIQIPTTSMECRSSSELYELDQDYITYFLSAIARKLNLFKTYYNNPFIVSPNNNNVLVGQGYMHYSGMIATIKEVVSSNTHYMPSVVLKKEIKADGSVYNRAPSLLNATIYSSRMINQSVAERCINEVKKELHLFIESIKWNTAQTSSKSTVSVSVDDIETSLINLFLQNGTSQQKFLFEEIKKTIAL